ncbi:MAG: hypothetical protein HC933_00400 [Pleurocapsa sp. SU_196_0]|nr:hypothetical protein [Pleurocapsa sp. SU_196_0]
MKRLLIALCCLVSSVALAQTPPPPSPAQLDANAKVVKQYLFNTPFSQLDNLVVGDPVKWVAQAGAPLARAKIGQSLQRFALLLCITGFLVGLWRARVQGNTAAYAQVFVRFVVGAVLVSVSLNMNGEKKDWNISAFVFAAWTNGYGWAVDQFGDDVDAALIEAQDALGDTISQVTISAVSLVGAQVGVQGFRAAARATWAGEGAAGAGTAAGKALTGYGVQEHCSLARQVAVDARGVHATLASVCRHRLRIGHRHDRRVVLAAVRVRHDGLGTGAARVHHRDGVVHLDPRRDARAVDLLSRGETRFRAAESSHSLLQRPTRRHAKASPAEHRTDPGANPRDGAHACR